MLINLREMQGTFASNVPEASLDVRVVLAERFTSAAILGSVAALEGSPDDAVFAYYSGHRAWDPNRGTYLLASGDGGRAGAFLTELRQQAAASQPRLSAVVLDCCNQVRPIPGLSLPAPAFPPPGQLTPTFDQLFFQSAGSHIIVSSSPGEYAVVLPTREFPDGPRPQGSLLHFARTDRPHAASLITPASRPRIFSDQADGTPSR